MTNAIRVTESVTAALGSRAGGGPVVEGCKILGLESKRGRRYRRDAVAKAAHLYEGKAVYLDHPTPGEAGNPRTFLSKFGVIKNVRVDEHDGGLRGDLHYNPKHIAAPTFEGWLETDPTEIGFSHNAWCRFAEGGDTQEAVEIVKVDSIDLVATPATTHGLFESDMPDPLLPEMPAAGDADAAPCGLDAAVSALLAAIVADPALDQAAKRKKVLVALKLMDDATEEGAPPGAGDGDEDEGEEKAEESLVDVVSRLLDEKLTKVIEAVSSTPTAARKAPISHAPKRDAKALTADDLVSALSGSVR